MAHLGNKNIMSKNNNNTTSEYIMIVSWKQHLWRWFHRGSDDWWSCSDHVMISLSNQNQLWPWIMSQVHAQMQYTWQQSLSWLLFSIQTTILTSWMVEITQITICPRFLDSFYLTSSLLPNLPIPPRTWTVNFGVTLRYAITQKSWYKTLFEIVFTWNHRLASRHYFPQTLGTKTRLVHLKTLI